ncbi:MAG: hypothetical protein EXR17_00995 [Flavobacteriaceae bacterium]|nr:hypothetical protein [Flavobacteriaceae bacterium]
MKRDKNRTQLGPHSTRVNQSFHVQLPAKPLVISALEMISAAAAGQNISQLKGNKRLPLLSKTRILRFFN